jgi:ribosomal protein L37E
MMGKRNAYALAAKQRKAGPHEDKPKDSCYECGNDMGYDSKRLICAQCDYDMKVERAHEDAAGV